MAHETVLGVMVLARVGDSLSFFQDPSTYAVKPTFITPLGGMQSFQLGSFLRSEYIDGASSIQGIEDPLVVTNQVLARSRHGPEGNSILDSAVSVLQGLYPPTPSNSITLANGTSVVAPLGGYQNIPIESIDPTEDISLQSWIGCPAFEAHVSNFYGSSAFKTAEEEAADFLEELSPYLYGRAANLKNIWNVHDFVSSQLTHNKTYAYELPPTFLEQTRALVNFHENGVFGGSSNLGDIGNVAARTILAPTITFLERIADKKDPLRLVLQQADYQPFISLFHSLAIVSEFPELGALPNHASAFAIEVREGKDSREYLRFKFMNATEGDDFTTVHVFNHHADIPLTEFIYRIEGNVIPDKKHWTAACNGKAVDSARQWLPLPHIGNVRAGASTISLPLAIILLGGVFAAIYVGRRVKARRERIQLVREYNALPQTPPPASPRVLPARMTSEKVRFM